MSVLAHKLPICLDPLPLAAAIHRLPPHKWQNFPADDLHVRGKLIILFRLETSESPKFSSDAVSIDPEVLASLSPALEDVIGHIPGRPFQLRLLKLEAGGAIHPHCDPDLGLEGNRARVHFVIATNPGVCFVLDGQPLKLRQGELWCLNAGLPHAVYNSGHSDRIHLVIDLVRDAPFEELLDQSQAVQKCVGQSVFMELG